MAGNPTELRATMREIEADPSSWDQRYTAHQTECGTTYCFGGRTLARHGYEPVPGNDYSMRRPVLQREVGLYRAAEILGLPFPCDETDALFFATEITNPTEMHDLVEAIIADDEDTIRRYL